MQPTGTCSRKEPTSTKLSPGRKHKWWCWRTATVFKKKKGSCTSSWMLMDSNMSRLPKSTVTKKRMLLKAAKAKATKPKQSRKEVSVKQKMVTTNVTTDMVIVVATEIEIEIEIELGKSEIEIATEDCDNDRRAKL